MTGKRILMIVGDFLEDYKVILLFLDDIPHIFISSYIFMYIYIFKETYRMNLHYRTQYQYILLITNFL